MILCKATPLGRVAIQEQAGALVRVYLDAKDCPEAAGEGDSPLLRAAFDQLDRYLAGHLRCFSLPLKPEGTPFMQRVWQALGQVPYGRTASYKDIAAAIGNPRAVRAVGMANHRNPLPIFVPCHRIIGSDGRLVGYAGGLALKERLLALEKAFASAPR